MYGIRRSKMSSGLCHYCGKHGWTDDHIVPLSLGGVDERFNLVRACTACNGAKAANWPTCECERCANAVARYLGGKRNKQRITNHDFKKIRAEKSRVLAG